MRTRGLLFSLLTSLLLALPAAPAHADDELTEPDLAGYISPEEEAPTALLGVTIGDAEVSLVAQGSWRLGIEGGIGLRIVPGQGVTFPASVASLASGFVLSHEPSVVLAVRIADRFYLEAAVSSAGGGGDSSELLPAGLGYLSMGYTATGEELLRSVTIGTRGVEMPEYAFLRIPAMGTSSLGAGAVLSSQRATEEVLLRVDKLPVDSVTYIGMNRLDEKRVATGDYLRGSAFLLPDRDVRELSFLIEDPGGSVPGDDGRHYRAATVDDASISASEGTVYLFEPAKGSLLVRYRDASGKWIGDTSLGRGSLPAPSGNGIDPDAAGVGFSWEESYLGRPLSERRVAVGGVGFLRLWEPGEFSPFEVPSSYALEAPADAETGISIDTVRRGSEVTFDDLPSGLTYRQYPGDGRFVVSLGLEPRAEMRERFPYPDPSQLLYGPGASSPSGYQECEIRLRYLVPVDCYQVAAPVVPGSVAVTRNGVEETGFSVDYGSGVVALDTPAAAGDVIVVRYRSSSGGSAPLEIVIGLGSRFSLGEGATLEVAGGLLWGAGSGRYTGEPGESTGGAVASVAIQGSIGSPAEGEAAGDPTATRFDLEYDAAVGVSISQRDTTGVRRLFGMEGNGWSVDLAEETAHPSATPASGEGLPSSVDSASRGELVYSDYRQYGTVGGAVLLSYDKPDWPPADQVHQYENGKVTGPYDVGGSSGGSSGTSLALEFTMDADQSWVGMQLPVSGNGSIEDLSWVEGVVCSLLAQATEGSYDVYLQIGALGEDLDGDSVLDREASSSSAGFSFDDVANGVSLVVGAGPLGKGNGVLDTEDVDGNGFLDGEESSYTVLVGPSQAGSALSSGTEEWATASYLFSAAERLRLTRARAVRVLLVKSSTGPCSGRLLVDRLRLSGSAFWAHPEQGGSATVREVAERDLGSPPAVLLPEAYPEVKTRYHADGSEQQVLELGWEQAVPAAVDLRGYLSPGSGGIPYRRLTLYLRVPSLTLEPAAESATVEVELVDALAKGIHASFSATAFDDWRMLVVDGDGGSITLGGAEPASADVRWDAGSRDLVELRLRVSGAGAGRLYLDEVALGSPQLEVGIAAEGGARLRLEGPLVSVGGKTLVSGFTAEERLSAYTGGFSSLFGTPGSAASFRSSTDLRAETAVGQLEAFAVVDASAAAVTVSGGHHVALERLLPPSWPVTLGWSDSFSYGGADSESARHEMGLTLGVAPVLSSATLAVVEASSGSLEQSWEESVGLAAGGVVQISLRGRLAKQASGYEAPGSWYGPWWVDGFPHLVPWVDGVDQWRRGETELGVLLPLRPLGLGLDGALSFSSADIAGGSRRQENKLEYLLRLPLSFRPSGGAELSIVPSYRSAVTLTSEAAEEAQDFSGDLAELGGVLRHHAWIFGYLPLVDVLHPAAMAGISERLGGANDYPLVEAGWHPELALELSRGAGSRILDLFLPVYASISFGRQAVLKGDLCGASTIAAAALRFAALNMFGSTGAHRLFSFYDSDEISGTVSAGLEVPYVAGPDSPTTAQIALSQLYSMRRGAGLGIEVANRLSYLREKEVSFAEAGEVRVGWLHLDKIPLPALLTGSPGKAGFQLRPSLGALRHVESLGVTVGGPLAEEGGSVAVTAGHESILEYKDLGSLEAHASLAVDFVNTGGKWAPGIGIQAGVSVELHF